MAKPPPQLLVRVGTAAGRAYYRLTGGRFFGPPGTRTLLLTTTGRHSGQARTVPLNYVQDGDHLAIVASFAGSDTHPSWYLNLQADPVVQIRIGRSSPRTAHARTASPDERDRLWPAFVAMHAGYARYRSRTTRDIPIVVLEPAP